MKRSVQGLCIVLGSIIATIAVLSAAIAWGPHHCDLAFPAIVGCAAGSYEGLAAGMIAAGAALFAGWLAWSAVQVQIAAEEKRAAADRIEVEDVLQDDLDYLAEGLGPIWQILLGIAQDPEPSNRTKLEGVIYGIEIIAKERRLNTSRKMVTVLGWKRRHYYEKLFDALEDLWRFRNPDDFDVEQALSAIWDVSDYLMILRPDTAQYFDGLWRRTPKAWSLGYAIQVYAGVIDSLGQPQS